MDEKQTAFIPAGWQGEEFKVFKYWAMNYPKQEIAAITAINIHNVDMMIRNIYVYLDVHSRSEMIQQAWLTGFCTKETFEGMKRYQKKR